MSGRDASPRRTGTLWLVPSPLDFGIDEATTADIRDSLPQGTIEVAARLAHWVAEDAKSARAMLKRVHAAQPLALPLQSIAITELPRPMKGGGKDAANNAAKSGARAGRTPSAASASEAAFNALLAPALAGHDLGLVSEAGLPAVADPGARLVAAAHAAGVPVQPLPGSSALLLALAASGLNGQSFAFVGYLPVDAAARAARIRELEALSRRTAQTQLLIETPYRNAALLQALLTALAPTTMLSVSCALTTPVGWTRSQPVARWREQRVEMPARLPAVFALLAA